MFRSRILDAQLLHIIFFRFWKDKIVAGNDWLAAANQHYHQITNSQRIQFRMSKDREVMAIAMARSRSES